MGDIVFNIIAYLFFGFIVTYDLPDKRENWIGFILTFLFYPIWIIVAFVVVTCSLAKELYKRWRKRK